MNKLITTERLVVLNGEKFRKLRRRHELTQGEVASASGVAVSYVSEAEAGKRRVTGDNAKKMALALYRLTSKRS